MPARDKVHDIVKNALIKDGWTITDDPLTLKFGNTELYVDLGAEKVLAAEKEGQKIAVEIKSFLGKSIIAETQDAIGQFIMYREVLSDYESDRTLFLAISEDVLENDFSEALKNLVLERLKIKVLIFNIETEEITKWLI
jgi:XisH protein